MLIERCEILPAAHIHAGQSVCSAEMVHVGLVSRTLQGFSGMFC
jgi:hypothetical protein